MFLKGCTKCKEEKSVIDFYKNKSSKNGYDSWCKECKREYKKRYRNSERGKEIEKSYKSTYRVNEKEYEKNRRLSTERKEYQNNYRKENKDRLRKIRSEWGRKNPERITIYNHVRMAKKKELRHEWGKDEYEILMKIFNNRCVLTGEKDDLELDHFIALSTEHGGTYIGNMIPLKAELNNSKNDKNPFEWIKGKEDEVKRKFEHTVKVLAEQNNMDIQEFKSYVNSCYESKKEKI